MKERRSPSTVDLNRFFTLIAEVVSVRRHIDLMKWLQGEVQQHIPHDIPPRHNSCRLNRTKNLGGGDEGLQWHDTDKHSRTGRLRGCCRLKARRWN